MIKKRNDTLQFFREMEHNIKMKIERARQQEEDEKLLDYYYGEDADGDINEDGALLFMDEKEERELQRGRFNSASSFDSNGGMGGNGRGSMGSRSRLNSFSGAQTRRIRTISTMDGKFLLVRSFLSLSFLSAVCLSVSPPVF
jgi:hypothetical protein